MARLLNDFRIPAAFTINSSEQEHDQGENYYKLRKNDINNELITIKNPGSQ